MKPQVQFFSQRCIRCGECITLCEHNAHALISSNSTTHHIYDRSRCTRCGECIVYCCAEAVQFTSRQMTIDQVMAEVVQDTAFYETSGGGVTLSGGEPLLQREFSRAILSACRDAKIPTAIETSAHCRWQELEGFLPLVDLVMMDIKHIDADKHTWATGVPNHEILANTRRLATTGKPMTIRIPVIPTVNDTPEEISAIAAFVASLSSSQSVESSETITLELLPFHRLAGDKYASLDLDYRARDLATPTKEQMTSLLHIAQEHFPNTIAR